MLISMLGLGLVWGSHRAGSKPSAQLRQQEGFLWEPDSPDSGQALHASSPLHSASTKQRYNLPAKGQEKEQTRLP